MTLWSVSTHKVYVCLNEMPDYKFKTISLIEIFLYLVLRAEFV